MSPTVSQKTEFQIIKFRKPNSESLIFQNSGQDITRRKKGHWGASSVCFRFDHLQCLAYSDRRIRISTESVLQAPTHNKASTLPANGSEFPAFKLASLWVLNSPEIRLLKLLFTHPKQHPQASLKTHRALELESKNCCRLCFLHPHECPPESSLLPPGQISYSPFLLSRNSVFIW